MNRFFVSTEKIFITTLNDYYKFYDVFSKNFESSSRSVYIFDSPLFLNALGYEFSRETSVSTEFSASHENGHTESDEGKAGGACFSTYRDWLPATSQSFSTYHSLPVVLLYAARRVWRGDSDQATKRRTLQSGLNRRGLWMRLRVRFFFSPRCPHLTGPPKF